MKFFTAAFLSLSPLTTAFLATPPPIITIPKRQSYKSVPLTFNGVAAGEYYSMTVVTDDIPVPTTNISLPIASISMYGHADFLCWATGDDGNVTGLVGSEQNVPVSPPEPQISIQCSAPPSGRR